MARKIGFIGIGNMGRAMVKGIISSGLSRAEDIYIFDIDQFALDNLAREEGVIRAKDNRDLVEKSDIIIYAVGPKLFKDIALDIKDKLTSNKIFISIAAGLTIENIEGLLNRGSKVVRVMPNTPVLVGEGMSGIAPNKFLEEEEINFIMDIFNSFGKCHLVDEDLLDVVTGISGSSPAYVFIMIEAMADAAVLAGMERKLAYKFAGQAVLGSAKMLKSMDKHPGELKDMVCSPGGTSIKAVAKLEEEGFRNSIISAIEACIKKSMEM